MTADHTDSERISELETDNRRLRRLLDGRSAPGELRHRLRRTLSLLRTIIRRSADTERDLPIYVAHLEDRLDALTRAQATADEHGLIDLAKLVADELLLYGAAEGDRLKLSGSSFDLQPRAGQTFALAVHELAINAVEHGALGTEDGRIAIAWRVVSSDGKEWLDFEWKETSSAQFDPAYDSGFGLDVLTRALNFEMQAVTDFNVERDGIRCTIRLPLSDQVGAIAEPEPG